MLLHLSNPSSRARPLRAINSDQHPLTPTPTRPQVRRPGHAQHEHLSAQAARGQRLPAFLHLSAQGTLLSLCFASFCLHIASLICVGHEPPPRCPRSSSSCIGSPPSEPTNNQQAKCGVNQVINITASVGSILDQGNYTPEWRCKDCPDGSVSNGRGFACMVCPPGTYADRTLGRCRACAAGYYNLKFGAKFCQPCAADTFAPFAGSLACIKVGAASSVISCKLVHAVLQTNAFDLAECQPPSHHPPPTVPRRCLQVGRRQGVDQVLVCGFFLQLDRGLGISSFVLSIVCNSNAAWLHVLNLRR